MKNKILGFLLVAGASLAVWLLHSLDGAGAGGVRRVVPACDGVPPPCYTAVQAAVDAAMPGDEILVAEGRYIGATVVTKSLAVRGGYTTTNWAASYPVTQPTTLDGGGLGSVLFAPNAGDKSFVFEGLHVTGGNAGNGGGIAVGGDVVLKDNVVFGNVAASGGGIYLSDGAVSLIGNTVVSNSADLGAGLYLNESAAVLDGNIITGNVAARGGAGVVLLRSSAVFTNTVIADNASDLGLGVGLHISLSSIELLHTTIARNVAHTHGLSPCYGSGLFIHTSASVTMTNSVIAGHKIGACVPSGFTPTLHLENTLWYSNEMDFVGTVSHTMDARGNPSFTSDGYHLDARSSAVDKGASAGVLYDVDGQPRAGKPDLGADEYVGPRSVWLPIISK